MERNAIVQYAADRDFILAPDALAELEKLENTELILSRACSSAKGFLIDLPLVQETLAALDEEEKAKQIVVVQSTSFKPAAKELEGGVEILAGNEDVHTTGGIEDFVSYFKSRYAQISLVLKNRMSKEAVVSAGKLKNFVRGRTARVVGMVADKRETKNGHTLIELEDEDGVALVFVGKDSPLKSKVREVIPDEVIAVDGSVSGDLFIAKDFIWPDIPLREKNLIADDVSVAFLSDVHAGSRLFLKDEFENFLQFLNGAGTTEQREQAGKIKYLLIAGDLVDGIGAYPGQEKELLTKDVFTQYEIVGEYLKNVPEYVHVVIAPGNHDAVRIAEPQPPLLPEFVKGLLPYKNIHFVGNPGTVRLHGEVTSLLYHGSSAFSMLSANPALTGALLSPEKIGIEWLRRRHLSPIYGTNPILSQKVDSLEIREPPDILHFGHIHHNGYADYRGTFVVNSGSWQDATDYNIRQGLIPTPGQLPVYNLKTGNLNVSKFFNRELNTQLRTEATTP